ncbi:MAG: flavodoxin family protein [Anaerolineales bacterium]|nr:flavodoxin family protein [Anaerolineales bacterium]
MRKILGVVGSPRKRGNTHLLVERILEGARAAGAETEEVLLGELNIRECIGCHACWNGKPCSRMDDMNELYSKIATADAFVFGTPVYWYGPTALMKCFIDRFVYFNCPANRGRVRGKSAVLAIPFEEENPETAALVTAFFEKSLSFLEMGLIGSVIVPGMARKGQVRDAPEWMAEAGGLGPLLANGSR